MDFAGLTLTLILTNYIVHDFSCFEDWISLIAHSRDSLSPEFLKARTARTAHMILPIVYLISFVAALRTHARARDANSGLDM